MIANFNRSGLPEGLSGKLLVKLSPDGKVLEVKVHSSSGSELFDERGRLAVRKSSPLLEPEDIQLFKRLGHNEVLFTIAP